MRTLVALAAALLAGTASADTTLHYTVLFQGKPAGAETAIVHTDGRVETSCPDCGEPLAVDVRDERVDDESLLFHCLVPAAHWWDDIVFT